MDRAGDPLDGLINLFDLSLVLAVGLLLAALSSIGATGLIIPQGGAGEPVQKPPTQGQDAQGQGQEVGKVYRLSDGRYVFAPSEGATKSGGATGATGATGGATGSTSAAPGGTTGSTGVPTPSPGTGAAPPTGGTTVPVVPPGGTTD